MVFYYGRRFESASVGTRLVEVVCERCGCEYLYELARIGSGAETAPYGIGSGAAARSAEGQARKDLRRRLEEEAELVPCPKCHWINEDLVSGFRRGRYRGWTKLAVGLGAVGTCVSLIGAWFLSLGPPADRTALPYVLIGGPTISMGLAGSILILRSVLRERIQPNRAHPLPPQLPRGSPAPLIRNPATGAAEPAVPIPKPDDVNRTWIDFQVGRNVLPPLCCRCLATTTPSSASRHPMQPAVELTVPLCTACSRRLKRRTWLGAMLGLGLGMAVAIPVLFVLNLDEVVFWAVVAGLGVICPIIGSMIAGYVDSPFRVKIVDGSRGVVRLWFRNEDFAKRIATNEGAPA